MGDLNVAVWVNNTVAAVLASSPDATKRAVSGAMQYKVDLMMAWNVQATTDFEEWLGSLDDKRRNAVIAAITFLGEQGPTLFRPFVERIHTSTIDKLKELRPRGAANDCRILFAFDLTQSAILLITGDKTNKPEKEWYKTAIPKAEALYAEHCDSLPKDKQ